VREFAQLAITAGGGVALEGMNGAANVADDLGVGRILLHGQSFLVESLQEFLRALEEEIAEFFNPFVGEEIHGVSVYCPFVSSL
jgi:ubiquinone biosynthesis protein UbiJ